MKRVQYLTLFVVLLLLLSACSSQGDPATDTATGGMIVATNVLDVPSSSQTDGEVVARINGIDITRDNFVRELQRSPAAANASSRTDLERNVLETMIEQELINQGAQAMQIIITEDDVNEEVAELKDLAGSEESWQDYLTNSGYTEQEMIDAQYSTLLTHAVRDALMADYMGEVEQVQARHIVVATLEEAEDILQRLANGEGFATLAAEYSMDRTTQQTGGNLGWFTHNELFHQALEDAAFSLEVGEMAGPISTGIGYHIIQTMDKATRPIEPDRLPILSDLVFNRWLDEQYRNANIEQLIRW